MRVLAGALGVKMNIFTKLVFGAIASIFMTSVTLAEPPLDNGGPKVSITVPLSDGDGNLASLFSFPDTTKFGDNLENADGSIKVITTAPATKCGFVHIWVTLENGDLFFINDVNGRVTRFLKGQAAEWAENWLVATAITGRKVFLSAIEGVSPGARREYNFAIQIGGRGEISLASAVRLKLPERD